MQTILKTKRETIVEANRFIYKFMPSNLINKIGNYLGKYKLPKCTKGKTENLSVPINIHNLITSQNQPLHRKEQSQDVLIYFLLIFSYVKFQIYTH